MLKERNHQDELSESGKHLNRIPKFPQYRTFQKLERNKFFHHDFVSVLFYESYKTTKEIFLHVVGLSLKFHMYLYWAGNMEGKVVNQEQYSLQYLQDQYSLPLLPGPWNLMTFASLHKQICLYVNI